MFFTMSDEARLKAFKWGFVTVLAVWALLLMSDPAHAAATGERNSNRSTSSCRVGRAATSAERSQWSFCLWAF